MTNALSDAEIERLAGKRAGAKMGWFIHLAVYVLVNGGLFILASDYGRHRWSIYPAMGWGVGLAFHGLSVFVLGSGSRVRQGMVQRERERLQRERIGL